MSSHLPATPLTESDSAQRISATAPGNLLIGGEYVILEEGGVGLAAACGPQARGACWPGASDWSVIHAATGEGNISLNTATDVSEPPFIIRAFRSIQEELVRMGCPVPVLEIEINTKDFYVHGRKLGFGSSAAATVILTGLMYAASLSAESISRDEICRTAVRAHRKAQGKRGSGYDVLTSCYGGAGLFVGGEHPKWQALKTDHPLYRLQSYSFPGPREVDSREAVKRYRQWKSVHGKSTHMVFQRSQDELFKLHRCTTEEEFIMGINELRLVSTELGDSIGVKSWISPPTPFYERAAWKGSGAGNELGLLFLASESQLNLSKEYSQLHISPDGLNLFSLEGDAILH